MMTHAWVVGQSVYIPFWVLLDYDRSPREPFKLCRIVAVYLDHDVDVADVEPAEGMVVPGIPVDYLIAENALAVWAQQIAEWFSSFPDKATPRTAQHGDVLLR